MEMRRLGTTNLTVSAICLGTMTWGRQNSEAEGHAQMDEALERGVTFWDTAEMYAIPPQADTYGATERIIGTWFRQHGGRDRIVLTSKVIGRSPAFPWVRDGKACLDRRNIVAALEASLQRLGTDYIDLYQIHWPDRSTNRFGVRDYQISDDAAATPLAETLVALDGLVRDGKIRHIGLSNETAWGTMSFLKLSEQMGLTRIATIQNAYSLLNRTFETAQAEISHYEQVGLLAYAPLAAGTLSGKYLDGAIPAGSRRAIDQRRSRYDTVNADAATAAYIDVARRHGLEPTQMALAFVHQQPFVTATIIGATSLAQLKSNIDAFDLTLSPEVLAAIETVHQRFPNPCP
ncbi:MAG: NADP(H)-dependent aldo-keto reductase [Azospirillaceae bacterium]|nr:NADP(H)-dependent aldo-keto reductase [Azospirillaceae bacterium]